MTGSGKEIVSTSEDRVISMGPGLACIPEKLLLAHARGQILFVVGAGVSQASNLPDFRGLVVNVYKKIDTRVHAVISKIPAPPQVCFHWSDDFPGFNHQQTAEIRRFINGDYDVVLGMLERRMEGKGHGESRVRKVIADELRKAETKPAPIHKTLMNLADRGGATTIVTTNFELLLEESVKAPCPGLQSYSLGGIPRPGRGREFSGVLHIHGALERNPNRASDLIVSDQDFGEFYLRRRVVPDFIYDAARLFNLVLVGYSANDPPMRYLLNAVAADGVRFDDLKERYAFIGVDKHDPVTLEDWKGRGITPISYDAANHHAALQNTLERWAKLSAHNGTKRSIQAEIRRIVKTKRRDAKESDRDIFDHLVRRSSSKEIEEISGLVSKQKAGLDWLDAIASIALENHRETKS